ncbi:MAG TPA: peptidylprolyl isomerase [Chitinophagales bacterium]|nr:peptidylprolyl isomerase [Chitinophagales bacterium]HNA57379.1 peptidylprolyl isomerase [Chitinophagales bacterium]HNI54954.1 peptidylprolyl isomerase [Chitinophagales bacterium]HNK97446.1 peptidylprolyl isomerase [Chitinophagales bacterium]HNM09631.1 peptidylprolyl isomerase [Chitinophagales bacterium]
MKQIIFAICCVALLSNCSEKKSETTEDIVPQKTDTVISTTTPEQIQSQTTTTDTMDDNKVYYVNISTTYGDMLVKLYNETPAHRDNFIKLVKEGYYNDLLFHRVIKDFMIQGGDPDSRNAGPNVQLGAGGPNYKIPAEIKPGLYHKKGALAAARQGDQVNPSRASSGSQFYIVQGKRSTEAELNNISRGYGVNFSPEQKKVYETIGGTPFLDGSYTVFGEVVKGLEVIDKIAAVKTMYGDRPAEDVKMKITIAEGK